MIFYSPTLEERCRLYAEKFPTFPKPYVFNNRIEGHWIMGNNYTTSGYYGAYPHGYLARVLSMFPDKSKIIHVCSGSLPPGPYTRVDIRPEVNPDIVCNVEELSKHVPNDYFDLALVDVPYSKEDAEHYGQPLLKRQKVLSEIHKILVSGGWAVWLDQVQPNYSKVNWNQALSIGIVKSTNHRVRAVFGFEKKGEQS
ncbi:MAG: hypothetical protein AB1403_10915 [Candidatus Riflebacteria bacterium]